MILMTLILMIIMKATIMIIIKDKLKFNLSFYF